MRCGAGGVGGRSRRSLPGEAAPLIGRIHARGPERHHRPRTGQKLSEAWTQQVLREPAPAPAETSPAEAAAKSAPDGYTWLWATTASSRPTRASTPGSPTIRAGLRAGRPGGDPAEHPGREPAVPATTVRELIALAKAKPGRSTTLRRAQAQPRTRRGLSRHGGRRHGPCALQGRAAGAYRRDRRPAQLILATSALRFPTSRPGACELARRLVALGQVGPASPSVGKPRPEAAGVAPRYTPVPGRLTSRSRRLEVQIGQLPSAAKSSTASAPQRPALM